jgi:hypothetical protein
MWTEPGQGRWVCPRCFSDNEAEADRCANCGLARGADPASAAVAQPDAPAEPGDGGGQPSEAAPTGPWSAAPQPEPERPGWLQLVLRFWWVGLLVIGGGIAAVNYLGGSRPVTEIGVGECFDLEATDLIDDVTRRDCTEPHQYEMFFVGDLPEGPFPSDAEVNLWIDANCLPAFTDYVGSDPNQTTLSPLFITPTEDAWDSGDHSVQCALEDPSDPELTQSLKDSAL